MLREKARQSAEVRSMLSRNELMLDNFAKCGLPADLHCLPAVSRRRAALITALCSIFCILLVPLRAQDALEYQRKAVMIWKLARYVEWPKEKSGTNVPLVIGVYGADNISDQIREVASRQKANNRDVVVRVVTSLQEIDRCHILFVSSSEERNLGSILYKARGEPVLTVGESASFLDKGGTVNFRMLGSEVLMDINRKSAKKSDLKLDPMLFNASDGRGGG
jgi:hypothetical protein